MNTTRIAIGADHGGFDLKQQLTEYLKGNGHPVADCGTFSKDSTDYPIFAKAVAEQVATGNADIGIVIDGAGIGSAMAANKIWGIRAAACYNTALTANAREHNDANIMTLGAGVTSIEAARAMVNVFLSNGLH